MNTWAPNHNDLETILQVLRNASNPDNSIQLLVQQSEKVEVRALAGIYLKNNLSSIDKEGSGYIKECVLYAVGDPDTLIRNTVGNIITTLSAKLGFSSWPSLIPTLLHNLKTPNVDNLTVEGSFGTLFRICEDSIREMNEECLVTFLSHVSSPNLKCRVFALSCINQFIIQSSTFLNKYLNSYISCLSDRAKDESGEVRKLVCQAFVMLVEVNPEFLVSQLNAIVEFMIFALQDSDPTVCLEACEFFLAISENEEIQEYLSPYLPKLIPILLEGMVYTKDEIIALDVDIQQSKPRFSKSKTAGAFKDDGHSERLESHHNNEDDADDDGSEEEEDDDDELYSEWTLRKCSAATLDALANYFQNNLLPILLPYLKFEFNSPEWQVREAGILALGAIALGCMNVEQELPNIVPFLFNSLSDEKYLIRAISCWTLGRYSNFLVTSNRHEPSVYLEPMISNMLRLLSDPSKKVQEAACSALATFSEEAGHSLVPYMQHILPTLLSTFEFYSGRNLIILYDTVASLAENVRFNGSKENCDLVLRTLEKKWNMLQNDDTEIFQLFECLSAVSSCMKHGFKDFAAPVYNRCIVLIQGTLTSLMKFYHNNGEGFGQEPDSDFIVYSLDLISSVICALGPLSIHFLDEKLMHVLPSCLQERNSSVRQSAAGVVGDLAMNCFDYIKGFSDSFVNLLIPLVDHIASDLDYNVSNNATWALGEIAMRHKFDAKAFVAKLLAVKEIIEIPRSLRENVAVTIGRLGILHSEFVSPYLENIAQFWCKTLRNTRDNPEKESSFIGFCKIVQENPNAIISVFPLFCDAIVGCKDVQNTTKQLFGVRIINKNRFFNYQQVLLAFKAMIGPQWDPYYSNFPQNLRQGLSFYGL